MPTRNVNLPAAQDALIEKLVRSGRYASASEVVRDALRHLDRSLEAEAARLDGLRDTGDAYGPAANDLDACMDRLAAEAMAVAMGEAWDEGLGSGPMRNGAQALARLRARIGNPPG